MRATGWALVLVAVVARCGQAHAGEMSKAWDSQLAHVAEYLDGGKAIATGTISQEPPRDKAADAEWLWFIAHHAATLRDRIHEGRELITKDMFQCEGRSYEIQPPPGHTIPAIIPAEADFAIAKELFLTVDAQLRSDMTEMPGLVDGPCVHKWETASRWFVPMSEFYATARQGPHGIELLADCDRFCDRNRADHASGRKKHCSEQDPNNCAADPADNPQFWCGPARMGTMSPICRSEIGRACGAFDLFTCRQNYEDCPMAQDGDCVFD